MSFNILCNDIRRNILTLLRTSNQCMGDLVSYISLKYNLSEKFVRDIIKSIQLRFPRQTLLSTSLLQKFKLRSTRHDILIILNSGDWDLFFKLLARLVGISAGVIGGIVGILTILSMLTPKRMTSSKMLNHLAIVAYA